MCMKGGTAMTRRLPAANRVAEDRAVIGQADRRRRQYAWATGDEQGLELLRVNHVAVAQEAAFEQLLAVVARDKQDRVFPHPFAL